MITLTYHYWVATTNAAGMQDADFVAVPVDYETDDQDQAMELAERHWVAPAGYIEGTLSIS